MIHRSAPSLKIKLLRNLLFSLLGVWAFSLALSYYLTDATLNQQQDLQLQEIASSLSEAVDQPMATVEIQRTETYISKQGKKVEFQIWRNSQMIDFSRHAPKNVLADGEGFGRSHVDDKDWRVFQLSNDGAHVMVGEDLRVRQALIRDVVLSNVWPMALSFPLIAILIWVSVHYGIRPLEMLATEIKTRSVRQLSRIELANVPAEIIPVVESLNRLFELVAEAFDRERQFADNAAHELRTPLAALKVQAQVALRSKDDAERTQSLQSVSQAVDRASKIVNQLLILARLDPESTAVGFVTLELNSLLRNCIARFVPAALAKGIEISLSGPDPIEIRGNADWLDILFSNLIDNAIRYSEPNQLVSIRVDHGAGAVRVRLENRGRDIAEVDRERIFNRFVRLAGEQAEGSGIGLAIVKKIADLHTATLSVGRPTEHSGVSVQIRFASVNA